MRAAASTDLDSWSWHFNLRHGYQSESGGIERVRNRAGTAIEGRRVSVTHPGVHLRGDAVGCGESLESGRRLDGAVDEQFLQKLENEKQSKVVAAGAV